MAACRSGRDAGKMKGVHGHSPGFTAGDMHMPGPGLGWHLFFWPRCHLVVPWGQSTEKAELTLIIKDLGCNRDLAPIHQRLGVSVYCRLSVSYKEWLFQSLLFDSCEIYLLRQLRVILKQNF